MTSDFRQYVAENNVTNFWRYPIRRRVTYASALELGFKAEDVHSNGDNHNENFHLGRCIVGFKVESFVLKQNFRS